MANPVLESFRESPKACATNSSHPPEKLKGKENPDLPSVCSNYWPPNVALSLCFNRLVLLTFQKCRSAIPKRSAKPIARFHHTVLNSLVLSGLTNLPKPWRTITHLAHVPEKNLRTFHKETKCICKFGVETAPKLCGFNSPLLL